MLPVGGGIACVSRVEHPTAISRRECARAHPQTQTCPGTKDWLWLRNAHCEIARTAPKSQHQTGAPRCLNIQIIRKGPEIEQE